MKSVLISIQPYWIFLIIAKKMGWNIDKEKTVEVRKNRPKDNDWNKTVKIYCSKDRKSFAKIPKEYQPLMEQFLGKVIGEFVCDKIFPIRVFENGTIQDYNCHAMERSCVPYDDIVNYIGNGCMGYGWHIQNLVIYDKPKELSEFWSADKCPYASTDGCTYKFHCFRAGETKRCGNTLSRPPQSWCYVEEMKGGEGE